MSYWCINPGVWMCFSQITHSFTILMCYSLRLVYINLPCYEIFVVCSLWYPSDTTIQATSRNSIVALPCLCRFSEWWVTIYPALFFNLFIIYWNEHIAKFSMILITYDFQSFAIIGRVIILIGLFLKGLQVYVTGGCQDILWNLKTKNHFFLSVEVSTTDDYNDGNADGHEDDH